MNITGNTKHLLLHASKLYSKISRALQFYSGYDCLQHDQMFACKSLLEKLTAIDISLNDDPQIGNMYKIVHIEIEHLKKIK